MPEFRVVDKDAETFGRRGVLDIPHGPVKTPAFFPVLNLIGGSTIDSGGIWRYFRDNLIAEDHLQGVMFQAMSFTDYNLNAKHLDKWLQRTFHEWFDDLEAPVFVDSGGFKLMNSDTFGKPPQEGGSENDWGLYTNPESILGLQIAYGADALATLDYPIPPNLKADEIQDRLERSIESAVRCLRLIESPEELYGNPNTEDRIVEKLKDIKRRENDPGVFVALHGHDYETVNWYVAEFFNQLEQEDVSQPFQGFAVGSLVPLRSKYDVLVDIVQGAKDAIPEHRTDETALHVFGVGGDAAPLLALLGVDSFDSSSHMREAMYKRYVHPETWDGIDVGELATQSEDGQFPCTIPTCPLCRGENSAGIETVDELNERLQEESTPEKQRRGRLKSPIYALVARHNFEVFNLAMLEIREAISRDGLLDHVIRLSEENSFIRRGLKHAQVRDSELRETLENRKAYHLLPGPEIASDQAKLSTFGGGVEDTSARRISLEHAPSDFDITMREYHPPSDASVLLIIPCSQTKPYGDSRSHQAILSRVDRPDIHKVTVSGMYGPVPEELETCQAVLEYEYVLVGEDSDQIELVTDRLIDYLEDYGDAYDTIVAYATNKNYRQVIENAFDAYGRGEVFPRDPRALKLTEHFRESNIDELISFLEQSDLKSAKG